VKVVECAAAKWTSDLRVPARWRLAVFAVILSYLTSLVVFAGASFGLSFIRPLAVATDSKAEGMLGALTANDGLWYCRIAREGYSFDPNTKSTLNYFPLFPLLGYCFGRLTGVSVELALVAVANIGFASAAAIFAFYLQVRCRVLRPGLAQWIMIAFCLWPVSLFFRTAYSESVFVFMVVLAFTAMCLKWHPVVIALLIGAATACRPVGVALCPVFILYLWERRPALKVVVGQFLVYSPLTVWGLMAFLFYQHLVFGDVFAFNRSQEVHSLLHLGWTERLLRSVILEPVWSKYLPESPAWWERREPVQICIFSLDFANPIYFVVTVGLIAYGRYRKWIDDKETLFSAGVLAISYFAQGHRFMMMSQGRFAATCFPVYIVMGHLLARMPPPLASLLLALSACMLFAYSALFATWHRIY
jgi:hypothetical protein